VQGIRTAGYQVKQQRAEDRGRVAAITEGMSNNEYPMANAEVRKQRAEEVAKRFFALLGMTCQFAIDDC